MHAALARDTRLLRSAEGGAQIAQEPGIDPDDSRVDTGPEPKRARDIAGPNGGGKPIRCVIGQAHRFVLVIERTQMTAGSEYLFAHDDRGLRQSGPDRRLDPGAAPHRLGHAWNSAPADHVCTVLQSAAIVVQHLLTMRQADERSDTRGFVGRMARPQGLGPLPQRSDEAVEYRPLHVHSLRTQPDLPVVKEGPARDPRRSRIA